MRLLFLVLVGAVLSAPAIAEESDTLAGHWLTEVPQDDGEMVEIVLNLGQFDSRWVGEFDLPGFNLENYPVEVIHDDSGIHLHLTAIGMDFEGVLSDDGQSLVGEGRSGEETEEVVFQRDGPAQFSEGFLELEAAAGDASLVEVLSADGHELREQFNADHGKTRLLMLLAPT